MVYNLFGSSDVMVSLQMLCNMNAPNGGEDMPCFMCSKNPGGAGLQVD